MLFYDTVGPGASGVAVARVAIDADYRVPSKARELVGVIPMMTAAAPAANDTILAVGDIVGRDFRFQPCEFLFPVAGGMLGAVNPLDTTPMEAWMIHAPLNGNEILDIGVEPCSANAANGEAGLTMIYSTKRLGKPTIYSLFSRETAAAAAAAAITDCGDLRVDNGLKMHEVIAVASPGEEVCTTLQELMGDFKLKCSGWRGQQEIKFFHEPLHAMLGAVSGKKQVMGIMRLPFDVPFKSKQAVISAEQTNYDAFDALGEYVWGIRWIGT